MRADYSAPSSKKGDAMKCTTKYLFLFLLMVLGSRSVSAQIQLSIADSAVVYGDTLLIPVMVDSSLTGQGVLSYQLYINYNKMYIEPLSLVQTGGLSSGWNVTANLTVENRMVIAGAGTTPLDGKGVLFYVKATFKNPYTYSSTSTLSFQADKSYFNEGQPVLTFNNATYTITPKPSIVVSIPVTSMVKADSAQASVIDGEAPFSWSTTDSNVATVNSSGLLKAVGYGNVAVIAADSRGIIDTSSTIKVFGFKLSGLDTANYEGQEVSTHINVTDISGMGVQSGSFFLNAGAFSERMELISVEPGELLSVGVNITYKVLSNGIEVAFAQTEDISGSGTLMKLNFRLKEDIVGSNYFSFQKVLFNENIDGASLGFTINSLSPPSLIVSPSYGTKNYLVGEAVQFSATNNTGPVTWSVNKPTIASVSPDGLLTVSKGGAITVTATDSIGATFTSSAFNYFDVTMALPDTSMYVRDTLYYPVAISNIENSVSSLLSLDITFSYSQNVVNFLGISAEGSQTSGWSYTQNNLSPGKTRIAGAGSVPVIASGDIVYIMFKADTSITGTGNMAYINFDNILLNEGSPNQFSKNGSISISTLPLKPELVLPVNGMLDADTALTLIWSASNGSESYDFQLSKDSNFYAAFAMDTTGINGLEIGVSGMEYSQTYYWRVRGVNKYGTGNWSETYSFTTKIKSPDQPKLYLPVHLATQVDTSLQLVWSSSARADSFRVQMAGDSLFANLKLDITRTDTVLGITSLNYQTSYWWRVKAVNLGGESEWSPVFMFTTREKTYSGQPPVVLHPMGSVTLQEDFGSYVVRLDTVFSDPELSALTFEMMSSTDLVGYEIRNDSLFITSKQDTSGIGTLVIKATNTGTLSVTDTLTLIVAPVNDFPVFVSIPDTLTFANTESLVFMYDSAAFDVEDGFSHLTYEFSASPNNIQISVDVSASSVTITAPGFIGEGKLSVKVTDSKGATIRQDIVIIVSLGTGNEVNTGTGIPDRFSLVQNYPNPFNPSTKIGFGLPSASYVRLEVYNMLGQKVATLANEKMNAGIHQVSFDAQRLSSGIYIYRLQAGNFVETKQMTLIK